MSARLFEWHSFLIPKEGHAPDECEDAVAGDPTTGRFATADGASESYASGDWARRLVEAFVATGPADNWLGAPRRVWLREATGSEQLSWYAEEKLSHGGHATFLGVTIQKIDGDLSWEAIAVGDACLFVISHGALLSSFPIQHSSQFSHTPELLTSNSGAPAWKKQSGQFCPGDVLVVATDALARLLLETAEAGAFAGGDLVDMTADDFALWVAAARSTGKLRNDDVAIGVVRWCGGE
jgi:hypothetical protein